jgi:hypothetical protein
VENFGCFHGFAIFNDEINITFFGYIPRSGIGTSYSTSVFCNIAVFGLGLYSTYERKHAAFDLQNLVDFYIPSYIELNVSLLFYECCSSFTLQDGFYLSAFAPR